MQFFIDSQGAVVNLISSPVYQGSTNACELVLVAPFSASNIIEADFRLPNGMTTEPYIMTVQGQMQIEGRIYNVWRVLLDGVVTEYAGKVTVQFRIYQSGYNTNDGNTYNPITTTSYASTFNVGKGVTPKMPDTPTSNVYQSILSYLSQLNPQYNIVSVKYSAPGAEINTDTTVSDLTREPANSTLKGTEVSFSIENIDGSTGNALYALGANYAQNTGFTITFAEAQSVGKMQLDISGAYFLTKLLIQATLEDDSVVEVDEITFLAPSPINIIVAVNKTVKSISLVQPYADNVAIDNDNSSIGDKGFTNGRFYINDVKLWNPSTNGQITITSSTGRTIVFPDASYDAYVSESEQARDEARAYAQASESSAQEALDTLDQMKKDEPNGVAGLDANGMININQIPAIVKHEYFEVTSVDDLVTLDKAEQGDIAYLLNADKNTVLNSWILLGGAYNVRANWKEQSTATAGSSAYADQAGTAQDASKVNGLVIDGVLSEADYGTLPSKQGVYFVSIEGGANGN